MDPRYEVRGKLGEGGMGVVLLAHDRELGRPVAIKRIRQEHRDDSFLQRLRREARVLGGLSCPHVVKIYDAHLDEDDAYLVMEFLDGETLEDRLVRLQHLEAAAYLRMVVELGAGVDALHATGTLHRDIKPGNVMFRRHDGGAVLMDLGLAYQECGADLTRTGEFVGTPFYVPPEVARGRPWSEQGDLFQLGVLLYTGATGQRHLPVGELCEVLRLASLGSWQDIPASRRDLSPALRELIWRCLSVEPARRPVSGEVLGEELRRCLGEGATAAGASPPPAASQEAGATASTPSSWWWAVPGGLALALLAALWPSRQAPVAALAEVHREALASDVELAGRRHLRIQCRHPVSVAGGSPGVLVFLYPGTRYLAAPDWPDPLPVLRWGAGDSPQELPLDPASLHAQASERLLPARAPAGTSLSDVALRELVDWLPDLLAGPLPASRRRALHDGWEAWSRRAFVELLEGRRDHLPQLPPRAPGSSEAAEPGGEVLGRVRLALTRPEDPEAVHETARLVTPRQHELAPWMFEDMPVEVMAEWPGPAPEGARRVLVSAWIELSSPWVELVLDDGGTVPLASFRHPRPRSGDVAPGFEGTITRCLPADLCPAPGTMAWLRLRGLRPEVAEQARLKGIEILWLR